MNHLLDDQTLQLLVDGELSDRRRGELLRAVDSRPEEWKRIALRLIEQQILDRELKCLVELPTAELPTAEPPRAVADATTMCDAARSIAPPSAGSDDWVAWERPSRGGRRSRLLALSAVLLIGVGLGVLVRGGIENAAPGQSRAVIAQNSKIELEEAFERCAVPVPDSFRLGLLQAGYLVDEVHTLTPVRLPTGDEIEIPVRHINVHYLGEAAYQ